MMTHKAHSVYDLECVICVHLNPCAHISKKMDQKFDVGCYKGHNPESEKHSVGHCFDFKKNLFRDLKDTAFFNSKEK